MFELRGIFFESNWINRHFGRKASNSILFRSKRQSNVTSIVSNSTDLISFIFTSMNLTEKSKISPKNRQIKIKKRQRSKNKTTEAPACFGSNFWNQSIALHESDRSEQPKFRIPALKIRLKKHYCVD
jgi:hypothetical protein